MPEPVEISQTTGLPVIQAVPITDEEKATQRIAAMYATPYENGYNKGWNEGIDALMQNVAGLNKPVYMALLLHAVLLKKKT